MNTDLIARAVRELIESGSVPVLRKPLPLMEPPAADASPQADADTPADAIDAAVQTVCRFLTSGHVPQEQVEAAVERLRERDPATLEELYRRAVRAAEAADSAEVQEEPLRAPAGDAGHGEGIASGHSVSQKELSDALNHIESQWEQLADQIAQRASTADFGESDRSGEGLPGEEEWLVWTDRGWDSRDGRTLRPAGHADARPGTIGPLRWRISPGRDPAAGHTPVLRMDSSGNVPRERSLIHDLPDQSGQVEVTLTVEPRAIERRNAWRFAFVLQNWTKSGPVSLVVEQRGGPKTGTRTLSPERPVVIHRDPVSSPDRAYVFHFRHPDFPEGEVSAVFPVIQHAPP